MKRQKTITLTQNLSNDLIKLLVHFEKCGCPLENIKSMLENNIKDLNYLIGANDGLYRRIDNSMLGIPNKTVRVLQYDNKI